MKRIFLASAVFAMSVGVSAAQTPSLDGLVNVNIQDVLQDIAIDLNIEETNIPVTIQLPISVAANVCDVSVNVLSAQSDSGNATCAAVTGSQELTQIVQQEMAAGGSTGGTDDTAGTDTGSNDDTADTGDTGGTDDTADADDQGTDDTTTSATGNANSAKEFAPGQNKAVNKAPGQTDDARANAPGQLKKEEGAAAQ